MRKEFYTLIKIFISGVIISGILGCSLQPLYDSAIGIPPPDKTVKGIGILGRESCIRYGLSDAPVEPYYVRSKDIQLDFILEQRPSIYSNVSFSLEGYIMMSKYSKQYVNDSTWSPLDTQMLFGGRLSMKIVVFKSSLLGIALKQDIGLPPYFPSYILFGIKDRTKIERLTVAVGGMFITPLSYYGVLHLSNNEKYGVGISAGMYRDKYTEKEYQYYIGLYVKYR